MSSRASCASKTKARAHPQRLPIFMRTARQSQLRTSLCLRRAPRVLHQLLAVRDRQLGMQMLAAIRKVGDAKKIRYRQ